MLEQTVLAGQQIIPPTRSEPSPQSPSGPGRTDAVVIARAAILHLSGDPEGALETLQTVSAADETTDLLIARGYIEVELKRFEAGLETFARVVALQPASPEALFQQGLCLQKLGRVPEAILCFEKAAPLRPTWIEIPLAEAICLLSLKQYEAAIEQADVCLKLEPGYPAALSAKAVALHLSWEPDRASALYQQVLLAKPGCVQTLMNLVTLGLQRKKYDDVRKWASELLAGQADNVLALEGIAVESFCREDFDNAYAYYTKLTELVPGMAEHWLNLGTVMQKQGRLRESAQAYGRAVQVGPDSLNAHVYLGAALWKTGDLAGARTVYEGALLKWQEREEVALALSQVLEELALTSDAELVCSKFCERVPKIAAVWFRLGTLQWKRSAADQAIVSFTNAVKLRPNWTEAGINLALAYQATGQLDQSESALETVRSREPNHPGMLRALATLALNQSKPQQALDLHQQLINLGEADEDVFFNCGVLAQGLNREEEAIRYYRQAIEMRKNFAEALLNLGHVLATTGHPEEARECWVPALELRPEFALTYFRRG